jgi:hypothetical protein
MDSWEDRHRRLLALIAQLRQLTRGANDDDDGTIQIGVRTRKDPPVLSGAVALDLPKSEDHD